MKFDWLVLFHFHFDWLQKDAIRAKNSAIHEKIALLRANQIARITSDFKMGVINLNSLAEPN